MSWVRGYEHVLRPMEPASALFSRAVLATGVPPPIPAIAMRSSICSSPRPLLSLLGKGNWTDYGAELCRRTIDIVTHDL